LGIGVSHFNGRKFTELELGFPGEHSGIFGTREEFSENLLDWGWIKKPIWELFGGIDPFNF